VNADGRYLRCAYRHQIPPDSYAYSIGFRVAYSLR
jgi:formylglycine-generating enzyme required for sulfatase activity